MKTSETGAWLFEGGHKFDPAIASGVADVLHKYSAKTVLDIGCGDGRYTEYLRSRGFDCIGYDGNPLTGQATGGRCYVADFSEPQYLGQRDAVLSLEVGEHIPEKYEGAFIDNLTRHADKLIVMSWALPEQGGYGHYNERPNEYIIDRLALLKWKYKPGDSQALRDKASNCYWFRETIMVFTDGR